MTECGEVKECEGEVVRTQRCGSDGSSLGRLFQWEILAVFWLNLDFSFFFRLFIIKTPGSLLVSNLCFCCCKFVFTMNYFCTVWQHFIDISDVLKCTNKPFQPFVFISKHSVVCTVIYSLLYDILTCSRVKLNRLLTGAENIESYSTFNPRFHFGLASIKMVARTTTHTSLCIL